MVTDQDILDFADSNEAENWSKQVIVESQKHNHCAIDADLVFNQLIKKPKCE